MSKKTKFTKERVYSYVFSRIEEGDPPTIREVQAAMGFKAVETARSYLDLLVLEGRLQKRENASRGYFLPRGQLANKWVRQNNRVPILGAVQAGALTFADQDIEGYLSVEYLEPENIFALRVCGYSMIEAGIFPDDLVIVNRQPSAQVGDIVVALVDEEATVKRLRYLDGKIALCPENPSFSPIVVATEELKLLGKVVEVRRYYQNPPSSSVSDGGDSYER